MRGTLVSIWPNMSYLNLSLSANSLLNVCHLMDFPLLFWQGEQHVAGASGHSTRAVLCVQPINKMVCADKAEVGEFVGYLESRIRCARTGEPLVKPKDDEGNEPKHTGWAGFRSGWAGYFAYSGTPAAVFAEYPFTLSLDFATDSVVLNNPRGLGEAEVEEFVGYLESRIRCARTEDGAVRGDTVVAPYANKKIAWHGAWEFAEYEQAFNQVMAYLKAGDCYQVNLAMPFYRAGDWRGRSPLPLLQSFNPSFGGYFKTDKATLFSVSPERFMCVAGSRMETRPIKGTVARGKTASEDEANKQWLAQSAKNQAENLMIVDLLRNDLSLYAKPHSVKVEKLFDIESHANVHHMVSTISAEKCEDVSAAEAIYAAFPGGSITGAPKKRATEVIAELEAAERGPYCGSLGYFDDAGFADFNILIRTVVAQEESALCWAGGGLVMDSTCEEEWQELHSKVGRILREFG